MEEAGHKKTNNWSFAIEASGPLTKTQTSNMGLGGNFKLSGCGHVFNCNYKTYRFHAVL